MGTAIKYSADRLKGILDSISRRIPYAIAAYANGIHEDTLYEWIRIGKKDLKEERDTPLSNFVQNIHIIEQSKIAEHNEKINDNIERWQADSWMLERRWWKYYSSAAPVLEFEERLKKLESKDNSQDVSDARDELEELKK